MLSRIPNRNVGPLSLRMGREVAKTSFRAPLCLLSFLHDRAADGKNEGAQTFEKNNIYAFLRCALFPSVGSTFLKHDMSNDMHCWSIHWVIEMIFLYTHTLTFFTPKKGAQTKKRARNWAPASNFRTPRPPTGAHADKKRSAKGYHSRF